MPTLRIVTFALLAVAASPPGGCDATGVSSSGISTPYDPCAGKACGDSCRVCPPDDRDCVETAVVKACDGDRNCAAAGTFACAPVDPCAGKRCGDSCNPCGDLNPCPTFAATACDPYGKCVNWAPELCR